MEIEHNLNKISPIVCNQSKSGFTESRDVLSRLSEKSWKFQLLTEYLEWREREFERAG